MYEKFYKLAATPFAMTPDADCYFMSPQHARALAVLRYSILTNSGITVVTGEVGTGKTTLVRKVLSGDVAEHTLGIVNNTHPNMGSILPWILASLGVNPTEQGETVQYHTFIKYLEDRYKEGKRTIVIVDEAQNLTVAALEELRLLSNLNLGIGSILQVVLVGQPELREKLALDELRQLAQRVAVDYQITEFNFEQTNEYIDFRLGNVGGDPSIFDPVARGIVYYHSLGIPRIINNICHLALAFGYGESARTISFNIIKQVIQSKEVGMSAQNRRFRSDDAVKAHHLILEKYGVDIATMERMAPAKMPQQNR